MDQRTGLILVVEDDRTTAAVLRGFLEQEGYAVEVLPSAEQCLDALARTLPDVVCLDLELPGMQGLEALDALRARHTRVPAVVLTANAEVETVVAAMHRGAYDYLVKPIDRTKLLTTIRNAAERLRMSERLSQLEREAQGSGFFGIIGQSTPMQAVFRQLDRVAASDVTVLVQGESGTGKELVARALHDASGRKNGPFVALNCAAVPEALQESEFFGHERGAFTGALAQRKGKFELADRGTLFLDEVADLSPALQAKLLRVLQERVFQRVGGSLDIRSDFRLIAATHRDLSALTKSGKFRGDLYFRLAVFELEVPPLRERSGDVLLLAKRFLTEFANGVEIEIAPDAQMAIEAYHWPGNVRELQNVMQRALVVRQQEAVCAADLPQRVREAEPTSSVRMRPMDTLNMEALERRALEEALSRAGGNVSEAVRMLGIGRTTAYRMMKRHGLR